MKLLLIPAAIVCFAYIFYTVYKDEYTRMICGECDRVRDAINLAVLIASGWLIAWSMIL